MAFLNATFVTLVLTPVKFENHKHKAKLSHEIFAGAAAWKVCPHLFFYIAILMDILQAAKEYEEHCARHGKPVNHAQAKAVLYISSCVCCGGMYLPSI